MTETKSKEDIEKDLQTFKEWVSNQTQLPKDLGDKLLLRFLHSCYYDLEKAKTTVQLFCTLRANSPELLDNRDPQSDRIQKTLEIVNLAQLKMSSNRNLWIWQLNDPGLDRYDYIQDARVFFLSTDAWLLNDDEGLEEEDIVVLDVKDISLKFLTKFNVSVAKKLSKYQEIHFHSPKSDTLLQYISKDELPEDFGGTAGRMEDHMKSVLELLYSKREYFLKNDLWKAKELKKSKGKAEAATTEVGSFRSLAID